MPRNDVEFVDGYETERPDGRPRAWARSAKLGGGRDRQRVYRRRGVRCAALPDDAGSGSGPALHDEVRHRGNRSIEGDAMRRQGRQSSGYHSTVDLAEALDAGRVRRSVRPHRRRNDTDERPCGWGCSTRRCRRTRRLAEMREFEIDDGRTRAGTDWTTRTRCRASQSERGTLATHRQPETQGDEGHRGAEER